MQHQSLRPTSSGTPRAASLGRSSSPGLRARAASSQIPASGCDAGVSEYRQHRVDRLVKRLSVDYEAVRAAVKLGWSNGPVEGQINRLKMLKRTMYGRAGLDLLGRRFLLAA
jgi:Transposase